MAKRGRDLFISYTSADDDWAEWIAWQLESAGYTTLTWQNLDRVEGPVLDRRDAGIGLLIGIASVVDGSRQAGGPRSDHQEIDGDLQSVPGCGDLQ